MRRSMLLPVLALILEGCQGAGTSFYDKQAEAEALQAAKKDPFDGYSDVVSVESVYERAECPQAPSPEAGPCLDVTVTTKLPARDLSGERTGQSVLATFDLFVWLKKGDTGRWKVTHTTYRPKGAGAAVDLDG